MTKTIIYLVPLILLTASCSDQKKIDYHIKKLEQITYKIAEDPAGEQIQKLFEQRSGHLDAIIRLGEFEMRTFALEHIPKGSDRSDEFHTEIFINENTSVDVSLNTKALYLTFPL